MRPPEFTGGNTSACAVIVGGPFCASMRPPEFTGGNGYALPDGCTEVAQLQ